MTVATILPASTPESALRPTARVALIDMARGIGITLVVAGHALGGMIDSAGSEAPLSLRYAFLAIYSFHMPLFFILAGLFVGKRLERGMPDFLNGLLVTVVYPYFLWSIIQFSIIYLMGSLVNHPVDAFWPTVLSLPWRTVSQFWFLHTLFLLHLLAAVSWRPGVRALLLIALALKAAAGFLPPVKALHLAADNAVYYAIGVALTANGVTALVRMTPAAIRAVLPFAASAAIIAMLWLFTQHEAGTVASASSAGLARLAWRPIMIPTALLACFAVMSIAASRHLPEIVARLGRNSMPIFLLHILFIAGTRIALTRMFGLSEPFLIVPLIIIGVCGPMMLATLANRYGFSRRLGFG